MKNLNDLLKRYTQIQTPHATIKKAFVKAVEDIIELELSTEDITISKNTVWVQAPSAIKNEIRLNQREILEHVSAEIGDSHALTSIF